jgi:hypothetical protein
VIELSLVLVRHRPVSLDCKGSKIQTSKPVSAFERVYREVHSGEKRRKERKGRRKARTGSAVEVVEDEAGTDDPAGSVEVPVAVAVLKGGSSGSPGAVVDVPG